MAEIVGPGQAFWTTCNGSGHLAWRITEFGGWAATWVNIGTVVDTANLVSSVTASGL